LADVEDKAVDLGEEFEGFRSEPYQDSGGVWTIGFGSTRDGDSQPVTASTPPVTMDEARALAKRDLTWAAREVTNDVTVQLTDNQVAALEDFIYNLGAGNFRSSTLLRKLNAGDFDGAAAEFDKWDRAAGQVLAGLLRRRQAETDLFLQQANTATWPGKADPDQA
jgi:lysozyme